jgi:hypothetical protein
VGLSRGEVTVRVLVISARFPEHGRGSGTARIRGDQVRGFTHISYLARRHAVNVVTAGLPSARAASTELSNMAHVRSVSPPRARRALSALSAIAMAQPAQVGWSMPSEVWRLAQEAARECDVALAMTTRSLRGPLQCPLLVDHVDALSRNLASRASGSESLPVRMFARLEAHLMERWERRVATFATGQIATSADHAALLPQPPSVGVLPVAWAGGTFREPDGYVRPYDLIVSGDMRYPPNREAALVFAGEILPSVRAHRPQTTALVAGRSASSLGLQGIDVASDVPDLSEYLRKARIAVVPLLRGPAGSPYKVIDAAANGAALVAVPWAVDCFGLPAQRASTPHEFIAAIISLLDNETLRRRLVADAFPVVTHHSARAIGRRLEKELLNALSRANPTVLQPLSRGGTYDDPPPR